MKDYKSQYQLLMEQLSGQITVLTEQENFALISDLNKEMALGIDKEKVREAESELELGQIVLNA